MSRDLYDIIVDAGRMANGEMLPPSGEFDPSDFQLDVDRNASMRTFTANEAQYPPLLSRVEPISPELTLVRSSEVDDIPGQLKDSSSPIMARNGYASQSSISTLFEINY